MKICTKNCGYTLFIMILCILHLTFIICLLNYYRRINLNPKCTCSNTWHLKIIISYAILSIIGFIYLFSTLLLPWIHYLYLLIKDKNVAKKYYSEPNSFSNIIRYRNLINYMFKDKSPFNDSTRGNVNFQIICNWKITFSRALFFCNADSVGIVMVNDERRV